MGRRLIFGRVEVNQGIGMNCMRIGVIGASLMLNGVALAADCPIEQARYDEAQQGYQIVFRPTPGGPTSMQTNLFVLTHPEAATVLDGQVAWNMGLSRPQGRLDFGCTAEKSKGSADARCLVWEGLIYALVDGAIELLPEEGAMAPDQILLTDLARVMRTALWDTETDLSEVPFEVFSYAGCAS